MEIESLALKTERIIYEFNGTSFDKGDRIVVQTPSNPGYHWGNFIILKKPPELGSVEPLIQEFDASFPYYEKPHHRAFTWDLGNISQTVLKEFESAGFEYSATEVLALSREQLKKPKNYNSEIDVRKFDNRQDLDDVIENQVLCAEPRYVQSPRDREAYRNFKQRQFDGYWEMSEAGLGCWFGAYLEGKLVGDLGLFHADNVGRFQSVETSPGFRRQGICRSLVYHVCQIGFEEWGVETLAIMPEPDNDAPGAYRSVGFVAVEKNETIQLLPEQFQT